MHPKGRMKKSFGDRSFSVAAPTLWNNLPASLRSMSSISSFKSQLKTHLFRLAFNSFLTYSILYIYFLLLPFIYLCILYLFVSIIIPIFDCIYL